VYMNHDIGYSKSKAKRQYNLNKFLIMICVSHNIFCFNWCYYFDRWFYFCILLGVVILNINFCYNLSLFPPFVILGLLCESEFDHPSLCL